MIRINLLLIMLIAGCHALGAWTFFGHDIAGRPYSNLQKAAGGTFLWGIALILSTLLWRAIRGNKAKPVSLAVLIHCGLCAVLLSIAASGAFI